MATLSPACTLKLTSCKISSGVPPLSTVLPSACAAITTVPVAVLPCHAGTFKSSIAFMKILRFPSWFKPFNDASYRPLAWIISLVAGLAVTPAYGTTILVLGDSLSAGFGIRAEQAWPRLLERRLLTDKRYVPRKIAVVNASISGETTAGGRSRLPTLIERHKPAIVIIELGANDGLRDLSLSAMKDNLNAMLQTVRKAGAATVLIGMRLPPNYGRYADEFNTSFSALAQQAKTPFVPFLLEHLADKPEHFQADRLHPTEEAQTVLLDNVWPTLQALIR